MRLTLDNGKQFAEHRQLDATVAGIDFPRLPCYKQGRSTVSHNAPSNK
jgi:hypothetical protein